MEEGARCLIWNKIAAELTEPVSQSAQPVVAPPVVAPLAVAPPVVPMTSPGVMAPPLAEPKKQDKVALLKEIKELLDDGALTQAEFDAQKKKILDNDALRA